MPRLRQKELEILKTIPCLAARHRQGQTREYSPGTFFSFNPTTAYQRMHVRFGETEFLSSKANLHPSCLTDTRSVHAI